MSATHVLDLLLSISQLLEADQRRELERRGLTPSRTHLLWVLHHDGPATQAQLAATLSVSARNVTTLVDALEATGFARRASHPSDRRAVQVHLTARGSQVMAEMAREHDALGRALTADLDDRDVARTAEALERIRTRLHALISGHDRASAGTETDE